MLLAHCLLVQRCGDAAVVERIHSGGDGGTRTPT